MAGRDPKTALSSEGLIGELKKALAERMLDAEMDVHIDGEGEQEAGNHRNGYSRKTILTDTESLPLSIPRRGETVKNKAVYLAIRIRSSGHKEVLGIWIEQRTRARSSGSR